MTYSRILREDLQSCRIPRVDLQSCRIPGDEAWVAHGLRWLGKASFPEDNWTQRDKLRRQPEPLSRTFKVLLTWEGVLPLNSLIPYTSFPKHITLSWNHLFMHPFPCQLMSWDPCFSVVTSLPPCTVPMTLWVLNNCIWGRVGGLRQRTKQNLNKVFWVTTNLSGHSFHTRDRAWISSEFCLSYPSSTKPSGWTWPGLLYTR